MALTRRLSVTPIKQDGRPVPKSNSQTAPQSAASVTVQPVLGGDQLKQYLFIDQ